MEKMTLIRLTLCLMCVMVIGSATSTLADITSQTNKETELHFEKGNASIRELFRDEQRNILNQILEDTLNEISVLHRQMYDNHFALTHFLHKMRIPLPRGLSTTVEFVLNTELRKQLANNDFDIDLLKDWIAEYKRLPVEIDKTTLSFVASRKINSFMEKLFQSPEDLSSFEMLEETIQVLSELPLVLDLGKAQNIYFSLGKKLSGEMRRRVQNGDQNAKMWLEHFHTLGNYLHVKMD